MATHRVFIGSSEEAESAYKPLLAHLEAALGDEYELEPWWSKRETRDWKYTLPLLREAALRCDYAILLFWPDDQVTLRDELAWQTRDNVIFELGLFLAEFGDKRTYFVCPKVEPPEAFHVLSDLGGIHRREFSCPRIGGEFEPDEASLISEFTRLAEAIKKEAEGRAQTLQSPAAAKKALDRDVSVFRGEIQGCDGSDHETGALLGLVKNHITQLLEWKAVATERSLYDAVYDLTSYFRFIDDMLDVGQLARKQQGGVEPDAKIKSVWVFSDEPLEFYNGNDNPATKEDLRLLRQTIAQNLRMGIDYTYVVPPTFRIRKIIDFLRRLDIPPLHWAQITIIHLEAKAFKTYFTVHIMQDDTSETYMSAMMEGRRDLLIKISAPHEEKILSTITRLADISRVEHGMTIQNFVVEGTV